MAIEFYASSMGTEELLDIPAIGLKMAVRLPLEATGGGLTFLETINAAGSGPPLHRHRETEIFRVMEGEYVYEVEGQRFEGKPGDIISVPGGMAHGFVNVSDKPGRQIVLMLPAMDAVGFFTGLADILTTGRPDRAALNAFGAAWGVEFLGPPISK